MSPSHEEWSKIRAARAMQNEPDVIPNPWSWSCRCGHPMREHRLDWGDPMADLAPDCGVSVEVVDQATGESTTVPCLCREFDLRGRMSP